eukprot:GHVS01007506.1.p1 GENE.GHVS01007506.1~~GHVS01007506.1.p1  ORF type:complete len:327 (+),score=40.93 GHVS01007506.1:198-1178(+)
MDVLVVGIHTAVALLLLVLLLSLQLAEAVGAKQRSDSNSTASVRVVNEIGQDVSGVTVVHKYSDDDLADKKIWDHIKNGESCDDSLNVWWYNTTGVPTNGTNWWKVFWYNKNGSNFYQTDPQNFPGVIDGLERFAQTAVPLLLPIGEANGTEQAAGTTGGAIPPLTIAARKNLQYVLNSESTSGFSQHTLRSEDANETTDIVLRRDGKVTFQSKSGNSTTATKIGNTGVSILQNITSEVSPRQSGGLPRRSCTRWGWKFYDGYDLGGGSNDIRWVRASHRNKCQPICRADRRCRAYSWTRQICFLKKGVGRRRKWKRRGVYSATMC